MAEKTPGKFPLTPVLVGAVVVIIYVLFVAPAMQWWPSG